MTLVDRITEEFLKIQASKKTIMNLDNGIISAEEDRGIHVTEYFLFGLCDKSELVITKRNSDLYPCEASTTINKVKYYALLEGDINNA